MRKAILGTLCALALSFGAPVAAADEACPEGTSQSMYDYLAALQLKESVDLNAVNALMQTAIGQCAGDRDLLNLIVYMTGSFAVNTQDGNAAKHWVVTGVTAYELATELEKDGWKPSTEWVGRDGQPAKFFPYNYATQAFKDQHIAILAALDEAGFTHPIISGEPLEGCIYGSRTSTRLKDETNAWFNLAASNPDRAFKPAIARLTALHEACTDLQWITRIQLAETYADAAERLAHAAGWYQPLVKRNPTLLIEAQANAAKALEYYGDTFFVPEKEQALISRFAYDDRKKKMNQIIATEVPAGSIH